MRDLLWEHYKHTCWIVEFFLLITIAQIDALSGHNCLHGTQRGCYGWGMYHTDSPGFVTARTIKLSVILLFALIWDVV